MLDRVRKYVNKWQMLTKEDCVVVGVSGGADSVCLLLVLLELQKEMGFDIVAVHVNHGLRGEDADADEAFVKQFCKERGVTCEICFENVELIAKKRKQSTEEAGREVRRKFFEKIGHKYHGTKLALAHHQNDNAETFLFHLARGTGLKGLGGIAPVKDHVIRPLLCVNRNEIEEYLQVQGVSYCTDKTNLSDEYTRNRIRNHIVPYMEAEVNSKAVEHMCTTMEQIRMVEAYLEEQTEGYFESCVKETEEGYFVSDKTFFDLPEVIQPLLLKKVLVMVSGKEKDIEAIHVEQLRELFEKQTGRRLTLPYQMEARREYDGVSVFLKEEGAEVSAEEIVLDLQKAEAEYSWKNRQIHCRILQHAKSCGESLEKNYTKRFDCDIIKNGICFRTRKQGDYITIHPDGRTQKLKAYFVNEKIPQRERDKILLVADGNHILWIVGHRVNCAYQTKENTNRVLEIHIDEGEKDGRDN